MRVSGCLARVDGGKQSNYYRQETMGLLTSRDLFWADKEAEFMEYWSVKIEQNSLALCDAIDCETNIRKQNIAAT